MYWQLVFIFIAIMVLIWSSVLMKKVGKAMILQQKELKSLLTAALSCVVSFLCEYLTNANTILISCVNI